MFEVCACVTDAQGGGNAAEATASPLLLNICPSATQQKAPMLKTSPTEGAGGERGSVIRREGWKDRERERERVQRVMSTKPER